jgi:hypothetical protein
LWKERLLARYYTGRIFPLYGCNDEILVAAYAPIVGLFFFSCLLVPGANSHANLGAYTIANSQRSSRNFAIVAG